MSWEQLHSISLETREEFREYQTRRPVACPNDGQPLTEGPDGVLVCGFDGWREGDTEWH